MEKQKKYYVITTGVCGNPLERGIAGPWSRKKFARIFLRNTVFLKGTRELVKVVEP